MSEPVHITFIGGSQDLTRRVMRVDSPRIDFPKMPPTNHLIDRPDASFHRRIVCEVENYYLKQVSANHYVALLDTHR